MEEEIKIEKSVEGFSVITGDDHLMETGQEIILSEYPEIGADGDASIQTVSIHEADLADLQAGINVHEAYIQGNHVPIVTAGGDTEHLVSSIIDGTELTTTTATLNGQQVIILTSGHLATEEEISEPPLKKVKREPEDEDGEEAQTYVLTVGGTEVQEGLQETVEEDTQDGGTDDNSEGKGKDKDEENQDTDITQAWFTTRDDKKALQSQGHNWRQGQWSKEEVDLLQQNIVGYCKDRGIEDPTEIIFEMSKDERKDFYRSVARGLERPLFSVYRRIIRMYDQKNHIGKYTPEEIDKLKELRVKHGSDWATIGSMLGRSASSVKDRCRLMRDTCNAGKWLPDEETRLAKAVYDLSGAQPGESVTTGLSWASVAERVSTRSEKQCRTKWLNFLNWKQKGGSDWTREDDLLLIQKLTEAGYEDEKSINWEDMCGGWASARSPQWLRGKWWSMKRHVPDYHLMSFEDILVYVKSMHSSNIRVKPVAPPTRIAKNDVHRLGMVQNMTLTIPVQVNADGTAVASLGEEGEGGVQALELLQSYATGINTSQGAYLITQPQNNPNVSFCSSSNVATDHIIVHTLPLSQVAETLRASGENVSVQFNRETGQHVIVRNPEPDMEEDSITTMHFEGDITSAEDLQPLGESDDIASSTDAEISQTGLEVQDSISSQEIITSVEDNFHEVQTISVNDIDTVVGHTELVGTTNISGDLVVVSTTSPQFVRSNSNDTDADLIQNMSSLSDPMLPTDSTDLIGSSSDVEGEKVPNTCEENDGDS